MSELVDAALDGYSVTVFAFGQTGSGKTHTMIGPRLSRAAEGAAPSAASANTSTSGSVASEDGMLARCVTHAYQSMESRKEEAEFSVSLTCLELYNETVRQDQRDGFQVVGLNQVACPSEPAAITQLSRALKHRHTRSHKLNNYSSRSHCLITFVFASKEKGVTSGGEAKPQGAAGGVRRFGKLVLVDLAGSERLKDTGNTDRDAVRETGSINKSLFTLGQVIAALSTRTGSGPSFYLYQDKDLTAHNEFHPHQVLAALSTTTPALVPLSSPTELLWDGLQGHSSLVHAHRQWALLLPLPRQRFNSPQRISSPPSPSSLVDDHTGIGPSFVPYRAAVLAAFVPAPAVGSPSSLNDRKLTSHNDPHPHQVIAALSTRTGSGPSFYLYQDKDLTAHNEFHPHQVLAALSTTTPALVIAALSTRTSSVPSFDLYQDRKLTAHNEFHSHQVLAALSTTTPAVLAALSTRTGSGPSFVPYRDSKLTQLLRVLAALSTRTGSGPSFVPYRDSKLTQLLRDGLRGNGRSLMLACLGPTSTCGPSFVPYRDSKLTQLLWDGLRGNGRSLMLACLGPTSTYADESLNTLHFASMALRIKSEPVMLLDPLDQLVLDLRNTIRSLQTENRQLAASLQLLSSGADVETVVGMMPQHLRASESDRPWSSADSASSPITPPRGAGHASHSKSNKSDILKVQASPSPSPSRGNTSTPPGQPSLKRNSLGSSTQANSLASTVPNGGRRDHTSSTRPVTQPAPSQPRSRSVGSLGRPKIGSPSPAKLGRNSLRSGGDLSQGGLLGVGEVGRNGALVAKSLSRDKTGPQVTVTSKLAWPGHSDTHTLARSTVTHTLARVTLSPLLQVTLSPTRLPGHSVTHKLARCGTPLLIASSPCARPVAGGGTVELCHPHACQATPFPLPSPPPPLPKALPAPTANDFPELDALEAEFQAMLGSLASGKPAPPLSAPPPAPPRPATETVRSSGYGPPSGGAKASIPAAGKKGSGSGAEPKEAEPKAVNWATQNPWFGADMEMTQYAYQVHDILVDAKGMDPSADEYFNELEKQVSERFPEKWAKRSIFSSFSNALAVSKAGDNFRVSSSRLPPCSCAATAPSPQKDEHGNEYTMFSTVGVLHNLNAGKKHASAPAAAASAGGQHGPPTGASARQAWEQRINRSPAVASSASQAPHCGARQISAPETPETASASGSGLEAIQMLRTSSSAGNHSSLTNAAPPLASSTGLLHQPPPLASSRQNERTTRRGGGARDVSDRLTSYSVGSQAVKSLASPILTSSPPQAHSRPDTSTSTSNHDPASSALNPFNLAHAPGAAPPKASKRSGGKTGGAGRAMVDPFRSDMSADAMQKEYIRQRNAVMEELRRAKDDAEEERRKIMAKINKVISSSRWRTK
eukprot:gene11646-34355_t